MASSKIKIRGVYRSGSHLPIWTIIEKEGIWDQAGLDATDFEYCAIPPEAEKALFKGEIDFISGDHPPNLIQGHAGSDEVHHVVTPDVMKTAIPTFHRGIYQTMSS